MTAEICRIDHDRLSNQRGLHSIPSTAAALEMNCRLDQDHLHDLLCVIRRKRGFFELLFKRSSMMKKSFNEVVPMLVLQGSKE